MAHANAYNICGTRPYKCPTKKTPSISFSASDEEKTPIVPSYLIYSSEEMLFSRISVIHSYTNCKDYVIGVMDPKPIDPDHPIDGSHVHLVFSIIIIDKSSESGVILMSVRKLC